jgi:hypothetical protein
MFFSPANGTTHADFIFIATVPGRLKYGFSPETGAAPLQFVWLVRA